MIDFSVPDAAVAVIAHCVGASRPLVVATTGLDSDQQAYLKKAVAQDSDRVVAEHEHGRQCRHEADGYRGPAH